MAGFEMKLLGPPSVTLPHGQPARRIGTAKGIALLAYLALEPGPHAREELAALLWGDSRDAAARASLRQALRRLRALLGDTLRIEHSTVELCPPVSCDVLSFLEAAERDPRAAAAFDVSRFLSGFATRHAPGFEEWAAARRHRLLERYGDVLRGLAREAIAQSHWREAVDWADRWLACDPLSDEAARLAVEALHLSGDRGAALARFAAHRDRLQREVGAKPGAALVELALLVEADATAPVTGAAGVLAPAPMFEASLVGRETAWRRLVEAWGAARRGAGRVVLLEGEAGVGKTRLAEEFLRWARLEGAAALRGRGYDTQAGVPYGPLVEALRGVLEAPGGGLAGTAPEWLTEVARLLPELRRRFPALPEPAPPVDAGERWRLFEAVAQLILAVAAERPTLVFIDDLQWCDGETCALLHFLTRRFEGSSVVLLATLTLGELERDAPAARLCRALRAQAHAVVVSLAPLTADEVWRMIREMGRIRAPAGASRLAHRVHEVTDGNPFYVIELIKTLFAQGLLVADPETGEWRAPRAPRAPTPDAATSYTTVELPRSVRDAIDQRVVRLPYELRDLLATIAVAGRGTRAELLSHVHGMSRLRVAALADALVERRLLVEEQGVYRCAHSVIADVVRESLTPARRRELHRALAVSLVTIAAPGEVGELAGEIARHAERGGERPLAYRYALQASDAAAARYAFDEALTWLDLAAANSAEASETDEANRRTARVLSLAGWREPPRSLRRSGARDIDRRDVDLEVPADRA